MTAALEGGEWSAARPGRTLPPGKTRYPLYRRLGGPQGRSGRAENLAPPGFDPRTFQPVVSRYTDWATRPTITRNSTQNLGQVGTFNASATWFSEEHKHIHFNTCHRHVSFRMLCFCSSCLVQCPSWGLLVWHPCTLPFDLPHAIASHFC